MATDREKMESARAYIKAGQIEDARRILVKIDHPKAKEWLSKLPPPKDRGRKRVVRIIIVILFIVVIVGLIAALMMAQQQADIANRAIRGF